MVITFHNHDQILIKILTVLTVKSGIPFLSNFLFERPFLLFLNDGIGFARWRRGSTCIKNIRVGASAVLSLLFPIQLWRWRWSLGYRKLHYDIDIQYHIVKYIGVKCLWGSFTLRFLFYFCCVLIDGDNAAMMKARHLAFAPKEWMATINMIQKKSAPCFEIRKKSTPCFEIFAGR